MSDRNITITNGSMAVNMSDGKVQVTTNAFDTMKLVGYAYDLYSPYEDMRDFRVMYQKDPSPALVVQEDISRHGSPCWKPIKVLTEDPQKIALCLQFNDLLRSLRRMEIEKGRDAETHQAEHKTRGDMSALNKGRKVRNEHER